MAVLCCEANQEMSMALEMVCKRSPQIVGQRMVMCQTNSQKGKRYAKPLNIFLCIGNWAQCGNLGESWRFANDIIFPKTSCQSFAEYVTVRLQFQCQWPANSSE